MRPLLSMLAFGLAVILAFSPSALMAQIQPSSPVGIWRCVSNSSIVSIDLQLQINPDQTLLHQGSIVYNQTSRIYNVRGYGRWLLNPPDASANAYLFRFQMQPQDGNHAMFSIFARPTGDPNFLNNRWQNPQTGGITETSCQRLG